MKKSLVFFRSIPVSILGMILVAFGWFCLAKSLPQKVCMGVFAGVYLAFIIVEIIMYFDPETNLKKRDLKKGLMIQVLTVITELESPRKTYLRLPWLTWNKLLLIKLQNGKQSIYRANWDHPAIAGEYYYI